ncbi:TolC family protein [Azospirillum picis]|uniref:Outer membrane protein TolC n=1 Tax=Azospirillum picis TaxID=488438 RepID=A0ABU0MSA1_9PROT|nr:TolC family protein [Azospirillum picis]MBP2300816.1 outer membrane protein TolC [Azospirillum picis]MDQ0536073.1 outer membrane protein TolC [Azospirillum picis]
MSERKSQIVQDKALMFSAIEPVDKPIGLYDAMARAIKYNLDRRVELLNEVVTNSQLDLAHYDMLPKLAASAGFTGRSNELASSSLSYERRVQSLEPSISTEKQTETAQLQLSWNVLDFGVSYIRAKQMADRSLIAQEQRRKVVQNIIQDVRYAYWRAVIAERLLSRLEALTKRTEAALADARRSESRQIRAPLEDLQYQRALLATLERLKELRRDLVASKVQLGALMNLPPGADFRLAIPQGAQDAAIPKIPAAPEELQDVALLNRPELLQASYQSRISAAETKRIYLEMLPGINLGVGGNYDSNKYAVHNAWASYGVNVTWNLLTLASTPARLDVVEADQKLLEMKRAALSMAVLAQVDVGVLRYEQAIDEYKTAQEQAVVDSRIFDQLRAAGRAEQVGELAVIQAEAEDVFATLRRDVAYASLQNAYGAILVAVGADPMPDAVADHRLPTLAAAIGSTQTAWLDGSALRRVLSSLKTPQQPQSAEAAPAASPVAAAAPASPTLSPALPRASTASGPSQPVAGTMGPQASAKGGYQVSLGTYASEGLARESWNSIPGRSRALLSSPDPVLVSTARRTDGKPFMLLRTAAFPTSVAAESFCDMVRQTHKDCAITALTDKG